MNDSTPSADSHVDFQTRQRKSVFRRLSTRAVIYPIIILAVYFLMSKNRELVEQGEREQRREQSQQAARQVLDASKPAELIPAAAPAFPQLIFYHENNLGDEKIIEKLRDKYYKTCTVQPVNLAENPALKQRFASQKTPFAVFSLPDGKEITFLTIPSFEFYDAVLESGLANYRQKRTPARQAKATQKGTVKSVSPAPAP